jgi:hypothetical protein
MNETYNNYPVINQNDSLIEQNANITTIEENLTLRNAIIISCYSIIVCVSLCGNLLVCKIAFGKKKMRTTTNMLIASLACSDIVMTGFNIPFNVARLLLLDWPFGSVLCFLVPFIQTSCVYVSTLTMTVIAMHRYLMVTNKTASQNFSCFRLIVVIIIIWLLAGTLSLPHSIYNEVKQVYYKGKTLTRCRVTYPKVNINFRLLLTVEVFITQYLMPLLIIILFYIKIGFIVSNQGKVLVYVDNERRRLHSEVKRKRIVMLALVVCVFALCWLPLNVYHLLVDFKITQHNFKLFIIVSAAHYMTDLTII